MEFNRYQRTAIDTIKGNIALIASAGSGKSSVLTHRTVNMIKEGIKAENMLCITFSKTASVNMQDKIQELVGNNVRMPMICTCHALGLSILKQFSISSLRNGLLTDYAQKLLLFDICVKDLRLYKDSSQVPIAKLKSFFDHQKINLRGPEDPMVPFIDENPSSILGSVQCAKIYSIYERRKKEMFKIDFTDMLFNAYVLLRDNEDVRNFYQNKYKYVLVDEAQDCNLLQIELIRLINMENVFFVGDFFQSIFGFTGCSPQFILNFKDYFPDAKYLNLPINYRCSKNIVDNANMLLGYADEIDHEAYLEATANKESYKDPVFKIYADTKAEAKAVCKMCMGFKKEGYQYKEMAVLTRINAQSGILQNVFADMEIPFEVIGGGNFYDRKEIKDVLSFLKMICNGDYNAFKEVYNTPSRYLGKVFLEQFLKGTEKSGVGLLTALKAFERATDWKFAKGVCELIEIIKHVKREKTNTVGDIILAILDITNYKEYLDTEFDDESKIDNIMSLVDQAHKSTSVNNFLFKIDKAIEFTKKQNETDENGEKKDSVKIMTVHKSKGLEFPVVFLVTMNEGMFPHFKSDKEEERRLAYVAATRAEKELFISSTKMYNDKKCDPSSFINEMLGITKVEEEDEDDDLKAVRDLFE